jgi:hypothetical protein
MLLLVAAKFSVVSAVAVAALAETVVAVGVAAVAVVWGCSSWLWGDCYNGY